MGWFSKAVKTITKPVTALLGGGGGGSSNATATSNVKLSPTTNVNFDTKELEKAFLDGNKGVQKAITDLVNSNNETTKNEQKLKLLQMAQNEQISTEAKKFILLLSIGGAYIYYTKGKK